MIPPVTVSQHLSNIITTEGYHIMTSLLATTGEPQAKRQRTETNGSPRTPRNVQPSPSKQEAGASPSTQEFRAQGTGLSKSLIAKLRRQPKKEVTVVKEQGMILFTFHTVDSEAYKMFCEWRSALGDDEDPYLSLLPAWHASPVDNRAVYGEAYTILQHYATLRAADFRAATYPPLTPPQLHPAPGAERYHHSGMALSKVSFRIANPRDALYRSITALPQGTIVCRLQTSWAHGHITIEPILRV
jgi:hypothetical protein